MIRWVTISIIINKTISNPDSNKKILEGLTLPFFSIKNTNRKENNIKLFKAKGRNFEKDPGLNIFKRIYSLGKVATLRAISAACRFIPRPAYKP